MTTQTLEEVEGLPEGWMAVAYRKPSIGIDYILTDNGNEAMSEHGDSDKLCLIVEKIQPRRIVLEETSEDDSDISFHDSTGAYTYWREVKETDIPLTNAEPKLSLSVAECKTLSIYGMSDTSVSDKIREFSKGK